jgi:outer membrane immunogenic protein
MIQAQSRSTVSAVITSNSQHPTLAQLMCRFKRIVLMAAMVLTTGYLSGQSPLPTGKSQFNIGVGFSEWGVPIYLGLDHGVHPDISLGAEFSFRSYNENWRNDKYRHNIMGFLGNANYHFNRILIIPSNWDFYAGLNLGFFVWSSPNAYEGNHNSCLGLGAQIGGRYYFSNRIGINLEVGGGNAISGGKFGLTFKF